MSTSIVIMVKKREKVYEKIGFNDKSVNDGESTSTIMTETIQNKEEIRSNEEVENDIETIEV